MSDVGYDPHDDIPDDDLKLSEWFDRVMHYRARVKRERSEALAMARDLVERYGAAAVRERLAPQFTVDAEGRVVYEDGGADERQDERFKSYVAEMRARLGNQIDGRLPPDTSVDLATGEVRIDRTKKGYW